MSEKFDSESDNFDEAYEDSFFDDALIEIANEITQLNAINATVSPTKTDPQITLKVEMELKKAESSSTNIFKILKTLQEVQVHSGPVSVRGASVTTERKYVHHAIDQRYHPITITETVLVEEVSVDYQNLTLEDLFEDDMPEENPSVVISQKKKPMDPDPGVPVSEGLPQIKSGERKPEAPAIKTVNIPDIISKNISQKLKENEKNLLKNFLRMQKK
jgi:hypothetical protein